MARVTDIVWRGGGVTITTESGVFEGQFHLTANGMELIGIPENIIQEIGGITKTESYQAIFGAGGTGTATIIEEEFIPAAGQTMFFLTHSYLADGFALFFVNGVAYRKGTDFLIGGEVAIWLNIPFTLNGGDVVTIQYERA